MAARHARLITGRDAREILDQDRRSSILIPHDWANCENTAAGAVPEMFARHAAEVRGRNARRDESLDLIRGKVRHLLDAAMKMVNQFEEAAKKNWKC